MPEWMYAAAVIIGGILIGWFMAGVVNSLSGILKELANIRRELEKRQ